MTLIEFVILGFGVWRLASLFAEEYGPFDLFVKIRDKAGVELIHGTQQMATNQLSQMLICVWCNSFWFGLIAVVLFLLAPTIALVLFAPFALSAMAIILEKLSTL